jgi:DNA primase
MDGIDPIAMKERRLQELLVAAVLRHPGLLDAMIEEFAAFTLRAPDLDRLRREIINIHAAFSGLDAASLKHHLSSNGFDPQLATLESPQLLVHSGFARCEEPDAVLAEWRDLLGLWDHHLGNGAEIDAAIGRFERDPEGGLGNLLALPEAAERRRLAIGDEDS